MRCWVRGDTHGDFQFLPRWCKENHTTKQDILIIAGDSGILFLGETKAREIALKESIQECPITLFCVRGNHDARPQSRVNITQVWDDRVNGEVYVDEDYPDILFALDGGEYIINGRSILTIGGAYSVDKYYRLMMHWTWFEDEQLNQEEMDEILSNVRGKSYDYVITHTCPVEYEPTWLFMNGVDQSKVEKNMEYFLQDVINNITYKHWFFGHYHSDFEYSNSNMTLLFNEYREL